MFQISVLSRCKQIPPRKSMYVCIYECPCNIWFYHRVLFPLCFLAINYGNISLISWFSILNQVNLMECLCHHDICYQQKHPLSISLSLMTISKRSCGHVHSDSKNHCFYREMKNIYVDSLTEIHIAQRYLYSLTDGNHPSLTIMLGFTKV